jgi:diphthine-ammonia ligase
MASSSLNVIALISGGKDSLFSLLHCLQNGHKIVALANLYPPCDRSPGHENGPQGEEGEDLNSFMYQTVGHTIIPLYAEALNLPVYRRQISGKAIQTNREYAFLEDAPPDETEDLVPLLEEVKLTHPEANALSSGAILSTYQRTRVESVAVRLGLTPLAYLWQYPALPPPVEREDSVTGLLDDMEAAECDARLWSRVSNPKSRAQLVAGMAQFTDGDELALRGAVLGEGGEYETLAINGPSRLWKKKIEVDLGGDLMVQDEGGATRLSFGKATLVDNPQLAVDPKIPHVRVPNLLDDKFKLLQGKMSDARHDVIEIHEMSNFTSWECPRTSPNLSPTSSNLYINNFTDDALPANVTEQTAAIMTKLDRRLTAVSTSETALPRVIFTTILLRNMSDFASVNTIYGAYFNRVNPPARVTICCGDSLPKGVMVSMSFALTSIGEQWINGLHVQSMSYWAPANIGPYAQAISIPVTPITGGKEEIVHLAGQIPLVPSSMRLLDGDFIEQAVFSLQHLWRVGQCVGVDWWTYGIAYLASASPGEIQRRAELAREIWKEANKAQVGNDQESADSDEEEDVDVWDRKYNRQTSVRSPTSRKLVNSSHLHTIPNHSVLIPQAGAPPIVPPFLTAHVDSLPRGASVEWHALGLAKLFNAPVSTPRLGVSTKTEKGSTMWISSLDTSTAAESESDSENEDATPSIPAAVPSRQTGLGIDFFHIQLHLPNSPVTPGQEQGSLANILHSLLAEISDAISEGTDDPPFADLTLYVSSQIGYDALSSTGLAVKGTIIPCRSLWGEGGRRVELAVLGRIERTKQ